MTEAAKSDPAAAYEALRAETANMLNYDLSDLSLVQGLQLDLVSLLRLEVDTLQGKVLAGDTVDLSRLAVAFGMLTKILPPAALEAEAPKPDFEGAREELLRLLQGRADALEHEWQRQSAIESELAAEDWRETMRPALPSSPPAPARHVYIDHAVLDDDPSATPGLDAAARAVPPPPVPVSRASPPQQSSDAEWLRWYRAGGATRQVGWDSPPRGW